jgi:hypothetical protein
LEGTGNCSIYTTYKLSQIVGDSGTGDKNDKRLPFADSLFNIWYFPACL